MAQDRSAFITRQEATALISCAVNLILTAAKFVLFYTFVKSVSLKAEAWHSLSDIGSSFVVFLALYMGRRQATVRRKAEEQQPAEEAPKSGSLFSEPEVPEAPQPNDALFSEADHEGAEAKPGRPVHRARFEDLVAVGIACLFLVVCVGIFLEILQPQKIETDYALLVAACMLGMAYISYLLYRFEYHVGIESDSPGLIADGYHSKIDMYGSILVAVALVSQYVGLGLADRIIAGFICLGILVHAVEVLAMAARHYLGRPIQREVTAEHAHAHGGALADVYALTGRWGERFSEILTVLFAVLFCIDRSRPDLGRRVARRVITVAVLAVVMLYVLSGLFTCRPGEQAFVERFGRPTTARPLGPGLHYRLPWPFERTVRINVEKIRTFQLGGAAFAPNQPVLWTNVHYTTEHRFLTGDDKFLTIFLVVHYRIGDLKRFLYECSNPEILLAVSCSAKVRELVGGRALFECITGRPGEIERQLEEHLKRVGMPLGLDVLNVAIRDMHPPVNVAPAFEAVISAGRRMHATINHAKAYEAREIPKARGRAAEILAQAAAYRERVVAEARGKTQAFVAQQEKYALAKDITRLRLYLEMLERTVAQTPKWVLLGAKGGVPIELWFPKGNGFWRWLPGIPGQGGPQK